MDKITQSNTYHHTTLSTGWLQEPSRAWFHNRTLINWGPFWGLSETVNKPLRKKSQKEQKRNCPYRAVKGLTHNSILLIYNDNVRRLTVYLAIIMDNVGLGWCLHQTRVSLKYLTSDVKTRSVNRDITGRFGKVPNIWQ